MVCAGQRRQSSATTPQLGLLLLRLMTTLFTVAALALLTAVQGLASP
jgi:hypothetical protein